MEPRRTTGRSLLIRNGNVFDGTGADLRPNCSVLVRNRVIEAMGQRAEEEARADSSVSVLDAVGKTVMPALVDAHCHITYGDANSNEELAFYTAPEFGALRAAWNCKRVLRAGVTTISEPNSVHNIGAALRDAIACGMVQGPRMITAGAALVTPHGTGLPSRLRGFSLVAVVESAEDGVKEIRRQFNEGANFIKLIGSAEVTTGNASPGGGELITFSPRELSVMVEEAHRLGLKVAVHARAGKAASEAARAGADWIFHCSFMTEQDLDVVLKSGAVILPTLTYLANMADWGMKVGVSPMLSDLCQLELKAASRILSRAHEMGAPMMIGSEAGFTVTPYGEWHAREMELFVQYVGYSPTEALVGMTKRNAELLGFGGLGVLEPGKVGDIIIVEGNPVSDIRVLQDKSKILTVIKEGQVQDTSGAEVERPIMPYEVTHPLSLQRLTVEKAYD